MWPKTSLRLVVAFAAATVLACSGGGGPSDAGADAAVDAPPPPLTTCLMVRNCVYLCAADQTCVQGCVDRAEAPARAVYDQVVACSSAACPGGGIDCRCDNECYAEGACLTEVDECTQSLQEGFCLMCV